MKQRYFLDGVEINEPSNYAQLEIELNYDKGSKDKVVSINEWDFGVGDVGDLSDGEGNARRHFLNGMKSGVGVFEGLPFKIVLDSQKGKTYTLFDGYIDAGRAKYANGVITAPATEQGKTDWLDEVADSFTFEYLESIGKIKSSDYIAVPYCINKKQNGFELIITLVTIFVVADKIQEQITNLSEKTAEVSNPFAATVILSIIIRILYIATLFVSLIGLIIKLYNLIIQPVKYHYGMYAKDLLRIGLDHLGLSFSSSILQSHPYDKLLILPEKYNLKENTGFLDGVSGFIKGTPNEHLGYYKGTFGELLRVLKNMFHARVIIDNGTLFFEKYNFNISKGKLVLPDVFDSRYKYELNVDDLKSTILISFSIDSNDRNTVQEYAGTSVQITTQPKIVNNRKMLLMRNLEEVRIPFALGKRKTELNIIEKALDLFLKGFGLIIDVMVAVLNEIINVVNGIISFINKVIKALGAIGIDLNFELKPIPKIEVPNFGTLIEDRIGMLKMESDFVNVPKMLLIENKGNPRNNKLLEISQTFLNARYIWENYQYFKSFVPQKDSKGNQHFLYDLDEIPFVFDDFEQARTSKEVINAQGEEGEIISLKFNPDKQTATGRYKIQKQYTNNLIETIYEPDGR